MICARVELWSCDDLVNDNSEAFVEEMKEPRASVDTSVKDDASVVERTEASKIERVVLEKMSWRRVGVSSPDRSDGTAMKDDSLIADNCDESNVVVGTDTDSVRLWMPSA